MHAATEGACVADTIMRMWFTVQYINRMLTLRVTGNGLLHVGIRHKLMAVMFRLGAGIRVTGDGLLHVGYRHKLIWR